MQINGYQIREAIKRWMLTRDTVQSQFKDSLHMFEGIDEDQKRKPLAIMNEFEMCDYKVALLEEVQQRFNQCVNVTVISDSMPLARAVKLVGGAGRREKMWREAAVPKKDRYAYDDKLKRDKDAIYARPTLTQEQALTQSKEANRYASALRNAIARGNNTDVNIESLKLTMDDYKELFT